ncbi:phosphate ABC transporter permease subunit PstC [Methanohalophilus sp.]
MKIKNEELDLPHIFFLSCMIFTAITTLFFISYIFHTAYPIFEKYGVINFITGTEWSYYNNVYGIWNYIAGSVAVTTVTIIIATPLSLFTAIFLSEFAPKRLASIIRPLIELLVGIPSVVYGIFGLLILENIFQHGVDPFIGSILGFIPIFYDTTPKTGTGVLLASTILTVMILPTITSISEDSIRSVPWSYREGSFALGSTKWETIRNIVLPAASKGIMSAIILGIMRAIGETMAVVMVLGGLDQIPTSIFDGSYAMTSKILNDISYYSAFDEPRSALFGIAAVLFTMEMVFVGLARKVGN